MSEQALLDALHDMQLWGIVGQSRDPSLGKGRCGSNDEFLEAYRALEGEVRCLISENEKLQEYAHTLEVANIDMASRLEDYIGQYDPTDAFVADVRAANERLRKSLEESEHDESMAWDRARKAEAENAKLRELVSLMDKRDVLLPCGRCCDADCRFHGSHCERIGTLMDELGFEVES